MPPIDWKDVAVVDKTTWTDGLVTLTLDMQPEFFCGQFGQLALEPGDKPLKRAYSYASAPNQPLEFFITRVDNGHLSPGLTALEPGDTVRVDTRPRGGASFNLDIVPAGRTLWFFSTGTGLAPFISMVRHLPTWDKFPKVVIVHSGRRVRDLGYREELLQLERDMAGRFKYLPFVTREETDLAYNGRFTGLLENRELEGLADMPIDESSHVMLCGNPVMIDDIEKSMESRGLQRMTKTQPGNFMFERWW